MAEQFDIYRNPSSLTNAIWPYYMIVQNDYYEDLATRIIMPMANNYLLPKWQQAIAPNINIDFEKLVLCAPMLTSIKTKTIAPSDYICNLRNARNDVIHAIDALITNT
ncbi:CcdB family protein [Pseudocitrobacter cyperus]|uniref:Toxin CcdB n=1 Tax=Pseudocitrobacter cyperus TaxID=3112843 RepID=A0ABV0HDQ5_9ENTR